jgi:hypothetical protein
MISDKNLVKIILLNIVKPPKGVFGYNETSKNSSEPKAWFSNWFSLFGKSI